MRHVISILIFSAFMGQWAFAEEGLAAGPIFKFGAVGEFDTYILSMSSTKAYCATHADSAECVNVNDGSVLTLHGLWPNPKEDLKNQYSFCGLQQDPTLGLRWCTSSIDIKDKISDEVFSLLGKVMRGANACLYNHEWYAHGTCSGLSVNDYFMYSAGVAEVFENLPTFNKVIQQAAGAKLSRADMVTAITTDLGPEIESAIRFMCSKDVNGVAYFSSIEVALKKNGLNIFPSSNSFGSFRPYKGKDGVSRVDRGSCPETGINFTP